MRFVLTPAMPPHGARQAGRTRSLRPRPREIAQFSGPSAPRLQGADAPSAARLSVKSISRRAAEKGLPDAAWGLCFFQHNRPLIFSGPRGDCRGKKPVERQKSVPVQIFTAPRPFFSIRLEMTVS